MRGRDYGESDAVTTAERAACGNEYDGMGQSVRLGFGSPSEAGGSRRSEGLAMSAALCLSCRHYDGNPGLAGDLPETYGICLWQPPPYPKPAVTMLWLDLERAREQVHTRMIPKRALEQRPDLWSECEAYEVAPAAGQSGAPTENKTGG
jgi:hypothetical protein